jgi:hypothetical protein
MLTCFLVGLTLTVGQVEPNPTSCRAQLGAPTDTAPVTRWVGPTPPYSSPAEPSTGQTNGPAVEPSSDKNGAANQNGSVAKNESKEPHSGENGFAEFLKPKRETGGFCFRLYKAYYDEFFPSKKENGAEEPEKPRRTLPSPWDSPPFPNSEY